jgi:Spy/CpxP family protein refolding chaperone
MKRTSTLLKVAALIACCATALPAAAATVSHTSIKPKSAQGHKTSMRHDQLTLYPHGKPARRQSRYGSAYNRFNQPTPIHNTFMGVQRY